MAIHQQDIGYPSIHQISSNDLPKIFSQNNTEYLDDIEDW
jgi:hypothetical protein